jgi:hypothetical protein
MCGKDVVNREEAHDVDQAGSEGQEERNCGFAGIIAAGDA